MVEETGDRVGKGECGHIGEGKKRNRGETGEMVLSRDPAIKLFGKTIQLPAGREILVSVGEESSGYEKKAASNKEDNHEPTQKNESPIFLEEKIDEPDKIHDFSATNEEKTNLDASSTENSKANKEQNKNSNNNNPMDKTVKKPDKILPCPRCKSMETKFCYYNNYNVNQPRHFCKNCQRYWTAGGSMRNVPVGAGRRKSKSSTANNYCRNITIPDCARSDFCESINHLSSLKPNGTVLSFGTDAPFCESMVSALDLMEKTMKNHNPNDEDQSNRSLATGLNLDDEGNKAAYSNCQGFPPYFIRTPWPNPSNHIPPFCGASSFPIYFHPVAAYWGMPWMSPLLSSGPSCSGLNSTAIGKHSREGNMLNHSTSGKGNSAKSDKCLWIPKTLRLDDPENAANCSVWATMGLKNDKTDSINRGEGLFKAFQSNGEFNKQSIEASQVMCANPAAHSRSLTFQERS